MFLEVCIPTPCSPYSDKEVTFLNVKLTIWFIVIEKLEIILANSHPYLSCLFWCIIIFKTLKNTNAGIASLHCKQITKWLKFLYFMLITVCYLWPLKDVILGNVYYSFQHFICQWIILCPDHEHAQYNFIKMKPNWPWKICFWQPNFALLHLCVPMFCTLFKKVTWVNS